MSLLDAAPAGFEYEYTVLTAGSVEVLIATVTSSLALGWVPTGGITGVPKWNPDMQFMQAMLKLVPVA